MTVHIVSTATSGRDYREMSKPKTGKDGRWTTAPYVLKSVSIKGGANLAGVGILTPKGVVTSISDEDYAWLKELPGFKRHKERGFLSVVEGKEPVANAVAGSMKAFDGSAPQNVDSGNAKHIPQASAE